MDLGLEGRVAIVTGASRGIGRGIAAALLAEGCHVVACARDGAEMEREAEEMVVGARRGARAVPVEADVTDDGDRERLVEAAGGAFDGRVDILVNNAGTVGEGGTLEDTTVDMWRQLFEVNLFAVVDLTRRVVPRMVQRGWGRVVNVSSENGEQPYPDMIHYNASKAALTNFGKAVSKAHAADGVLVNTVSPAFIRTPLVEGMMAKAAERQGVSKDEAVQRFLDQQRPHIEVERPGRVEEVAAVVAFLCSERASFVNGANVRVDGGSVAAV